MAVKILCADDEPDWEYLILQKFRKRIKNEELQFYFAINGARAFEIITSETDIDILISDINMPVMDGLSLLDKVNALNRPFLKTIIVSAYGDMENIRTAMNRGAFDFITKPIDFKDLEITIDKTINHVAQLKKSFNDHLKLQAIQQDLNTAKKIQQLFIPNRFPAFSKRKDIEIYGTMLPANNVGGDLYDFFLIDNDHIGFVIGDISGKGVPAAMFMAMSRSVIRSVAMKGMSPEKTMYEANNLLVEDSQNAMFITVFYGILDMRTGNLQYTNAGHGNPLVIFKNGPVIELEGTGNVVLAAMEDLSYDTKSFTLNEGDTILLYTDGVTDALNESNTEFTKANLIKLLENSGNLSVKEINELIVAGVKKFSEKQSQADDLTMLAFRFLGNQAQE